MVKDKDDAKARREKSGEEYEKPSLSKRPRYRRVFDIRGDVPSGSTIAPTESL